MNQLEILSEHLQNIITRKYPDYNGDKSQINQVDEIILEDPEFGIFDSVTLAFSPTSFNLMFNNENLQLSHLHLIIKLVNKLASFYGLDDSDEGGFRYKDLETISDDEDEYIPSIIRIWKDSFDNSCTSSIDISFQDNSAFFVICFDM